MLTSMTGFGRSATETQFGLFTCDLKTVNHKYVDLRVKLPESLTSLEKPIYETIKKYINRGAIFITINWELKQTEKSKEAVFWNKPLVEFYLNTLKEMKKHYHLAGEINIDMLLKFPEIFAPPADNAFQEMMRKPILELVETACRNVLEMRQLEGERLVTDLFKRLSSLTTKLEQLRELNRNNLQYHRQRLNARIEELFPTLKTDITRLEQEIVYYAEKSDVTEEITRLRSHIVQFENAIKTGGPTGRKLEFINQEMLREINTIGSKAYLDKVAQLAVEMKSEIDKMKEQVQNIE